MKFLKRLIITLFVIALLLVVAIIVLGVIAYDGSGLSYNPNSSNNMYNLIGSEFGKSLDKIYNSSYVVDDNKIEIGITDDALTQYVFDNVRDMEGNEKYYDGSKDQKTYIMESNNVRLNSVEFFINEDLTLTSKVRVQAIGFYQTSIHLNAGLSVISYDDLKDDGKEYENLVGVEHILAVEFNELKLGTSLGITSKIAKKLLSNFKFNVDSSVNFDFDKLALYMNFDEIMEKCCQDEFLLSLLQECNYSVSIEKYDSDLEPKLYLIVDTKNLFSQEVKKDITISNLDVITEISSELSSGMISLSEEEFNALIKDKISSNLNDFNRIITLGETNINLTLNDPYFSLDTNSLTANLKFNNTNSVVKLNIGFEYINSSKLIKISLNDCYAGNIKASNLTKNDSSVINELELSTTDVFGNIISEKITNIVIDKDNKVLNIYFN